MRKSQLLLLLLGDNKNESSVYTGKLSDYRGARRHIVAIEWSGGVVGDLLAKTKAGIFFETSYEIKSVLLEHYQEFLRTGAVSYEGDEDSIESTLTESLHVTIHAF